MRSIWRCAGSFFISPPPPQGVLAAMTVAVDFAPATILYLLILIFN
jgi:hypothetical protein